MKRSFILSLLASVMYVSVKSEILTYLYEWNEDFKYPHVLKYWYNDISDVWRQAKQSDLTGKINISEYENNLLVLQLDPSFSQALYFQTAIKNSTENAKLSIFITVLGCNSRVQLYWRGRIVLEGPEFCPTNIWIPLEYSTYLTEFEMLDLLLLVTGSLQTDSQPVLLISRLDVVLQLPRNHITPIWQHVLNYTTPGYEEVTNENTNSSRYVCPNLVITISCVLLLRILFIYNSIT